MGMGVSTGHLAQADKETTAGLENDKNRQHDPEVAMPRSENRFSHEILPFGESLSYSSLISLSGF